MRVVFSLPYGMAFRNLVCCGVLGSCVQRGARATVLIPSLVPPDAAAIRRELPGGVAVEELLEARPSPYFQYLKFVKQHLYARRTGLDSFELRKQRRRRQRPAFHRLAVALERLSERVLSEEAVDRLLAGAHQPHEEHYRRLLRQTRAEKLVITKPGYHPAEMPLVRAARSLSIPTISVDTTWDNMASKRPPYLRPDDITLWNDRMREEAIHFYKFPEGSVTVTGGAAFDIFFDRGRLPSREAFLSSLRLDPGRKLIVFALNHPMFTPDNREYIDLLLDAIGSGAIAGGPNLVVRLHPWDRESSHADAEGRYERMRVERPFGVPSARSVYECLPAAADVRHYGALLTHADVLINIASTTSLDALAAGTPIVNIAFDMKPAAEETSAAKFYDFSHYKPIVASGSVRLARSPEKLLETLNRYLSDRMLDGEARDRARHEFLKFTDGKSADRVAEAIFASGAKI